MTENDKIVNEIVDKNENIYGEIQDCCSLYKNYCTCNNEPSEAVLLLTKSVIRVPII